MLLPALTRSRNRSLHTRSLNTHPCAIGQLIHTKWALLSLWEFCSVFFKAKISDCFLLFHITKWHFQTHRRAIMITPDAPPDSSSSNPINDGPEVEASTSNRPPSSASSSVHSGKSAANAATQGGIAAFTPPFITNPFMPTLSAEANGKQFALSFSPQIFALLGPPQTASQTSSPPAHPPAPQAQHYNPYTGQYFMAPSADAYQQMMQVYMQSMLQQAMVQAQVSNTKSPPLTFVVFKRG